MGSSGLPAQASGNVAHRATQSQRGAPTSQGSAGIPAQQGQSESQPHSQTAIPLIVGSHGSQHALSSATVANQAAEVTSAAGGAAGGQHVLPAAGQNEDDNEFSLRLSMSQDFSSRSNSQWIPGVSTTSHVTPVVAAGETARVATTTSVSSSKDEGKSYVLMLTLLNFGDVLIDAWNDMSSLFVSVVWY